MEILTLDIETICTQRADVRDYLAARVSHPGNISKAETIAKWNEESRPSAIDAEIAKTGLDGTFGQIVCIGWAWGDSAARSSVAVDCSLTEERRVLVEFFDDCLSVTGRRVQIVGHNVVAFDLRFLRQRAIVHALTLPLALPVDPKPWDESVYDTMLRWAGVGKTISMDRLCLALGIPGKGDVSGADVWPMAQAGRFAEIAEYCRADVERTRAIHQRLTLTRRQTIATVMNRAKNGVDQQTGEITPKSEEVQ